MRHAVQLKLDTESTKNIPVVMVTAVGFDLNKKLAKQMGADGYVTKPLTSSISFTR